MGIVQPDRSIVPACDVDEDHYRRLIESTHDLDKIGAYKIGAALALSIGLPRVVAIAKAITGKPLIYDHQKAGTDIPDTADAFVAALKQSGIDAVIAFPLTGPDSEHAFIRACHTHSMPVIVGGYMTHSRYLSSQGGWIADGAVDDMFRKAASEGVRDFVVPGNKPEAISRIRAVVEEEVSNPVFYAPGFVVQGGAISDAALEAGASWHAIVGRGIYATEDMREAARRLSSQI